MTISPRASPSSGKTVSEQGQAHGLFAPATANGKEKRRD